MNKKQVRLVIFDWAGTVVDYGCVAPAVVFQKTFEHWEIPLTKEEILKPMGMEKKDHIRQLLRLEQVTKTWRELKGRDWTEQDVEEMYQSFEKMLADIVADYSEVMPGVKETVENLRKQKIVIGSTTGYTAEIMQKVTARAAKEGYLPDYLVTPEEVGTGRPGPFMVYENMRRSNVYPPCCVVKVGDTTMDILEGVSAGVWTVGILEGSSQVGLFYEEAQEMSGLEKEIRWKKAEELYRNAGADFVIEDITKLPKVVEEINRRLSQKEGK